MWYIVYNTRQISCRKKNVKYDNKWYKISWFEGQMNSSLAAGLACRVLIWFSIQEKVLPRWRSVLTSVKGLLYAALKAQTEWSDQTGRKIVKGLFTPCVCVRLTKKSLSDTSSLGLRDIVDLGKEINTLSCREHDEKLNTANWETGLTV